MTNSSTLAKYDGRREGQGQFRAMTLLKYGMYEYTRFDERDIAAGRLLVAIENPEG